MFGNSWRIARVGGVEIRIDSSWVVLALLIAYSMYVRFRFVYPRLEAGPGAALAIAAAILFFGSVLAHELCHALVSRARGIPVQDITLFLFGGATRARVDMRGPTDEFVIAAVGPVSSLVIAGVFWLLSIGVEGVAPRPLSGALGYLAWVNLVLAVFNLVPGFPLDGGRLLRAAVWRATGSLSRATRVASIAGQAIGWTLVGLGLLSLLRGSLVGGIWFAAIGWFLVQSARASYAELQVRQVLKRVSARDMMATDLVRVPADMTIEEAVDRFFMHFDHGAFPVEEGGRTIGLLTLRAVRQVPRAEWGSRRVRDVMAPLRDEFVVDPQTPIDTVLDRFEEQGAGRVLVASDGEVVGVITPRDIARWLQRREELGLRAA
jgi:Zn-dependent protease/CBS domain-containing protein